MTTTTVGVTYCTDALVEEHREELEALLGPVLTCRTDFRAAVTWLSLVEPATTAATAAALRVLARHGRMNLLSDDAASVTVR